MHLTITLAIIVIAILVVAAYFYATNRAPSGGTLPTGATGAATEAAINAVDQELNSATQNISTSNVESAIASQ